ncbi:MAG TPA: HEAT repeat domain-containing protein [Gammaproteobacteria bacterium]|nr:HEAT repeat domain-containing protein [Gammaproteobacteria bacterium]
MNNLPGAPDALLLVTSTCPNCPSVLESVTRLVKQGELGRLEIINLQQHPEAAEEHGVRSVPWLRIGALEFLGVYPYGELRDWARTANKAEGLASFLIAMLTSGQLASAEHAVRRHPEFAAATARLLADTETPMEVRIGLGAIYETLDDDSRLAELVPALEPLLSSNQARIRNDACYLLGLSGSETARPLLETCLTDADEEVRETAREGLDAISAQDQS